MATEALEKKGRVFWKDREVLRINEKYVEGYGWLDKEEYDAIMYNPNDPQDQLWSKIRQYNIQYKKPDGRQGQMDISYDAFWEHRQFID